MANTTRNSYVGGSNKSRDGLIIPSHLWDENNTPWDPDSNKPWEDEATLPQEFDIYGTPKTRNNYSPGTNKPRN